MSEPGAALTISAPLDASSSEKVSSEDERRSLTSALRGQYRILEVLGRGGMSAVYLAHDVALERRVALKVLAPGGGHLLGDHERFRREARILAALPHPSIVPVYASGRSAGFSYFSMRYVPGPSLAARLAVGPRFSVPAACAIIGRLADALDLVHRSGVVHRDLKPDNVILEGDSEAPTLIDFGVATVRTSDHSRSEVVRAFGTPSYMSPEHAMGEQHADGRTDLYSLGCVMFEMLAGRPPFIGGAAREIVAQHVARPAPLLGIFRPDIPPALERVVARCLAKNPADRWSSALLLRQAIADATDASAPRANRRSALGRWLRLG